MEINYLAVLVGAVLYFAGGALWYSPILFGNVWMREVGFSKEDIEQNKKGAWKSYLVSLLSQIIISYGIARLLTYMDVQNLGNALQTALLSWLAFVITTSAINGSFAGKSVKLWTIDNGYHLYGFLIAGIIIGVW